MAAAHAFLTQVSHRSWRCSECALLFISEAPPDVDRMLDRFVKHAKRVHRGPEAAPVNNTRGRRVRSQENGNPQP